MSFMTTSSNANLLQDVFLSKRFIEALRENLVLIPLALKEDAPRSSGKVVRWQYFGNPAAATTPLSEGSDPTSPRDLATTAVTATMQEFGDFFEPTKFMLQTAQSGTLTEIVEAAGYQAAITLDTLCFTQALYDTTNTIGAGATAAFDADNLRESFQVLLGASAKPHPATDGGRYFALVLSVEAAVDLMNEAADYSTTQTPVYQTIHQTDQGIRGLANVPGQGDSKYLWGHQIFISQNVPSESADQHNNYAIANEGFGAVSIDSNLMDPEVIITMPDERVDKALRGSGTVGWCVKFAAELLNSASVTEMLSDIT